MLTPKAREMVNALCASLDRSGLEEVIQIARTTHDSRLRRELDGWAPGQKVEISTGPRDRMTGTVVSVNAKSLTVDVGRKRLRVPPSAAKRVIE